MQETRPSDDGFESKLAGFVRSYIHASRGIDASREQDALRWVCSGLEYLLAAQLQECDGWRGWVDGILPATDMFADSAKVVSEVELSIRGKALWGEKARGPFWIEPFFGSVRLSDTRDTIVGYELKFADAIRGLGKVPYGKHLRRAEWFFPAQWLFVFSKDTAGEKSIAPACT
jgi:hypothetical protein